MAKKAVHFQVHKNVNFSLAQAKKIERLAAQNFKGNFSAALRFILDNGSGDDAAFYRKQKIVDAVSLVNTVLLELRAVGTNINQMARKLNAGELEPALDIPDQFTKLDTVLLELKNRQRELNKQIRGILNG